MTGQIRAPSADIAPDCAIGPGVDIEAEEVRVGPGCRIGFSDEDDFRTLPGVRIRVERLVLGRNVQIGRSVRIDGGTIRLDDAVRIARHASIRVLDELHLGAHGTVGEAGEISGRQVEIGQELWMLPQAKIGGGSAFERASRLTAGHFLHLGVSSLVNTARPVTIGHEVGLGTRTALYTHGAYPSRLMGFPVAFDGIEIGDFTWIPGAVVNPGVRIGRNCVIGVNSLVTSAIPDGSFAAGSPAKVLREGAYPRPLSGEGLFAFFESFFDHYASLVGGGRLHSAGRTVTLEGDRATYMARAEADDPWPADDSARRVCLLANGEDPPVAGEGWTVFDLHSRRIRGVADGDSGRLANELRRFGIRFYSRPSDDRYVDWEPTPPEFGSAADTSGH